jgi:hypothetical protein
MSNLNKFFEKSIADLVTHGAALSSTSGGHVSYDNWKQTDKNADEQAEQEARVASLAEQIRLQMIMSDFIDEIEISASFNTECCQAISRAFLEGVNPAILLHNYAQDWLDSESVRLARERLK